MSEMRRNLTPGEGPFQEEGSSQIQKAVRKLEEDKRKQEEEDDKIDFEMTEEETLDMTARVRKANRFLLSLLPELDKTDRRRLARAHKPVQHPIPTIEIDLESAES